MKIFIVALLFVGAVVCADEKPKVKRGLDLSYGYHEPIVAAHAPIVSAPIVQAAPVYHAPVYHAPAKIVAPVATSYVSQTIHHTPYVAHAAPIVHAPVVAHAAPLVAHAAPLVAHAAPVYSAYSSPVFGAAYHHRR